MRYGVADLARLSSAEMLDLTRLPAPSIIEVLDSEAMLAAFKARFLEAWAAARAIDPTLPVYDVEMLETDPAVIVGEAWTYLRTLDRARVNDAVRAVLAPLAKGSNLDVVCARLGVSRLTIRAATDGTPAVMESDERLLRRYLLAFTRPSAGSRDRYIYEALTAWPECHDAAVVGRAVHGRRGDTDIVLVGPDGRDPTPTEIALVRAACTADGVKPEATSVTVLGALRQPYAVALHLVLPRGPDGETVRAEAEARIRAAALDRMYVEAEVPRDLLAGAAYGLSVIRADLAAPLADIPADPYAVPVLDAIAVTYEVAA